MISKKVDLVHYKNGVRTVIGTAVVDLDDGNMDITATISEGALFIDVVENLQFLSIGFKSANLNSQLHDIDRKISELSVLDGEENK